MPLPAGSLLVRLDTFTTLVFHAAPAHTNGLKEPRTQIARLSYAFRAVDEAEVVRPFCAQLDRLALELSNLAHLECCVNVPQRSHGDGWQRFCRDLIGVGCSC